MSPRERLRDHRKNSNAGRARVRVSRGRLGDRGSPGRPTARRGCRGRTSPRCRRPRPAYGIETSELEEHYRNRTALGVNVLPEDIAQAVLHFASEARSGKSTGNMLNVDGGVSAAYPR